MSKVVDLANSKSVCFEPLICNLTSPNEVGLPMAAKVIRDLGGTEGSSRGIGGKFFETAAAAIDRSYSALEDLSDLTTRLVAGNGEIYLDPLIQFASTLPVLSKEFQQGGKWTAEVVKELKWALEENGIDLIRAIPKEIKRAKEEYKRAREKYEVVREGEEILDAAADLEEAVIHLRKIKQMEGQVEELFSIADQLEGPMKGMKELLQEQAQKISEALQEGNLAYVEYDAADVKAALGKCKPNTVETYLDKCVEDYGKKEADDVEAFLSFKRSMRPLFSSGFPVPEQIVAVLAKQEGVSAENYDYNSKNSDEMRRSYFLSRMYEAEKAEYAELISKDSQPKGGWAAWFFLGLQAMTMLRGAGSMLLGQDAAQLKAQAEQMHQQAMMSFSPAALKEIENDASFMGTLLSDKWEGLKDSLFLKRLSPQAQQVVQGLLENLKRAPTSEQVQTACDLVIKARVAEMIPSPFQHQSIGEWIQNFMTPAEEGSSAEVKAASVAAKLLPSFKPKSELTSFLDTEGPPIDQNLLLHLGGREFGKESGFESYKSLKMLSYVNQLLATKLRSIDANPQFDRDRAQIQKVLGKMEQARVLGVKFLTLKSTTFIEVLDQELENLEVGDYLFWQGGWTTPNDASGHSIVYEISKEGEETYGFRIYNQGEGNSFHASAAKKLKRTTLGFHEMNQIKKSHLLRPSVMQGLQELTIAPKVGGKYDPGELYENILRRMEGKINRFPIPVDQTLSNIHVGICTFTSLAAFLHQRLESDRLYYRLMIELEAKAAWDYWNQQDISTQEDRELLLRTARQTIQDALAAAAPERNHLSDEELDLVRSRMDEIIEAVTTNKHQSLSALDHREIYKVQIQSKPDDLSFNPEKGDYVELYQAEEIPPAPAYDGILIEPFTGPEMAKAAAQKMRQGNLEGRAPFVRMAAHEFARSLSLDEILSTEKLGSSFAKKITPEQALAFIDSLVQIASDFQYCLHFAFITNEEDRAHRFPIKDAMVAIKLLTVADSLARQFSDTIGIELPNMLLQQMAVVLYGMTAYSRVDDPAMEEEMAKIRNYWKVVDPTGEQKGTQITLDRSDFRHRVYDEHITPSFFCFEWAPAGYNEDHVLILPFAMISEDVELAQRKLEESKENWGARRNWPIVDWTIDYLNAHRDRLEELFKVHPFLRKATPTAVALAALSDQYDASFVPFFNPLNPFQDLALAHCGRVEGVLPKIFFHLWDLSFITNYLFTGGWNYPYLYNSEKKTDLDLKTILQQRPTRHLKRYKAQTNEGDISKWKLLYRQFGVIAGDSIRGKKLVWESHGPWYVLPVAGLTNAYGEHDEKLRSAYGVAEIESVRRGSSEDGKNIYRYRRSPNDRLLLTLPENTSKVRYLNSRTTLKQFHNIQGFPRETVQRLLGLSSKENLQIEETLSYFHSNPKLLEEPMYRDLLTYMLFEQGILLKEIQKRKPEERTALIESLAALIDRGYSHYGELLGNLEMTAFFLDLAAKVRVYFPYTDHLDPIPKLKQHLKDPALSRKDRSLLYDILAKTSQDPVDIVTAAIHVDLYPIEFTPFEDEIRRDLPLKNRASLFAAFTGPHRDRYLNEAIRASVPHHPMHTTWKEHGDFPLFQSADGRLTVDVLKGRYFEQGRLPRLLPNWVISNLQYHGLIGSQVEIQAVQTDHQTFEFTLPDGVAMIYREPALLRQIDGRWYQFQAVPLKLAFQNRALIEGHHVWYSAEHPAQTLILDKKTGKKLYRISEENGRATVHRDPDLVLAKTGEESSFAFLSAIEDPSWTLAWTHQKSGKLSLVEFPRLGLSFTVVDEQIKCDQLPGFFLSSHQRHPSLATAPNYLVLDRIDRNQNTHQVIAMPVQMFMDSFNHAFDPKALPKRDINASTQSLALFDVDPMTQKLIPRPLEGRLQLAMVYLWLHDYQKAAELIRGYGGQRGAFSEQESNLLRRIVHLDSYNDDHTPQGVAVRMIAYAAEVRQHLDFGESMPPQNRDLYRLYLHQSDLIPELALTQTEENLIKEFLKVPGMEKPSTVQMKIIGADLREKRSQLPFEVFYESLENRGFTETTLIRAVINGSNFFQIYQAIQNGDYRTAYQILTRRELPAKFEHEQARAELLTALSLIATGKVSVGTKLLSQTLAYVLTTADPLPSAEEMKKIIEDTRSNGWGGDNEKWRKEDKRRELFWKFKIDSDFAPNMDHFSQERPLSKELPLPRDPAPALESNEAYQHCLRLMTQPHLQHPVIDNLEDYLTTVHPSANAAVTEELEKIFQVETDEPLADAQLKATIEGIRKYGDSPEAKPAPQYSVKDIKGLQERRFAIEQEIFLMNGAESTLIGKLLGPDGANRMPADPTVRAERQALLSSGALSPITLDDLNLALINRNQGVARIKKLNPGLSAKEIDALLQETVSVLVHATERRRRQAVVDAIKDLEGAPADEISNFAGQLKAASETIRQFDPSQTPAYLVFEYYIGILLQGRQVEGLDKLLQRIRKGEGIHSRELAGVLEMIMGSGKTAVLTPLIAFLEANGVQISLIVMPEGLMPEKTQELEERMGRAFGRSIDVLTFDRSSNFDEEHLKRLIDRLGEASSLGKLVMVSSSSLQSLILRFIEDVLNKVSPKRIDLFRKLLAELRQFGSITFDELDAIADVLKLQIFSMTKDGQEREPANAQLKEATADLFKFLVTDKEIAPLLAKPFTPQFYESQIKPKILKGILEGKVGNERSELNEMRKQPASSSYLGYFWPQKQKNIDVLLTNYLLNEKDPEAFAFVDRQTSMTLKDTLAVLKQQICKMIPETFTKRVDEHFGLVETAGVDQETKLLSKPLEKGNWDVGSEHGTPEEAINYTLQRYLAKGVPVDFVRKEVYSLRDKLLEQLKEEEITEVWESPYFQKLMELTGGKRYQLERIGEKEIEEIQAHVNQNAPAENIYLSMKYAVEPQLKIFPYQLRADAQMLFALANVVRGFSGTLWNWQTFERAFRNVELSSTEAKTLHLLMANSPKEVITVDAKNLDGKLDQIFQGKPSVAIADVGNLFGDNSGEQVARKILERGPWKGAPYYDRENKLMVALRSGGSDLLATAGVAKEDRAPFWKQELCTGSDIPLGIKAEAVVTFSRYTMMRDLLQTVWRLRKLDYGQTVRFAVDADDKAVIIQTLEQLTKQKIEKLELSHLFLYGAYIQAMRIGDDNHRSLDQQLRAELIKELFDVIIQKEVTPDEIIQMILATQDLFLIPIDPHPYNQYGRRESRRPAQEVVEDELDQFLRSKPLKAFYWNPTLKKYCNAEAIEQRLRQIAAEMLPRLAKNLISPADTGTQHKVKTKTDTKTETQTQTQTKTKTQVQLRDKVHEKVPKTPVDAMRWSKKMLFEDDIMKAGSTSSVWASTIDQLPASQVQVKDALGYFHPIAKIFDPRLLTSLNRMPIYTPKDKENQLPFVPYDEYEDPVTNFALLIEEKQTGQIALMLLDQDDASDIEELMVAPPESKRSLALLNLETGKTWRQAGAKIADRPDIHLLKAQAKLVNGFLGYTIEEKEALQDFLKGKDLKAIEEFVVKIVLGNRERSLERYPHSDLSAIFKKAKTLV